MAQIIPIRDLKNTAAISELCHETDEPIYVTKNGYGDMVIMSMDRYEKMSKRLEMYESLILSEQQIKEGRVLDALEALESMKEKVILEQQTS